VKPALSGGPRPSIANYGEKGSARREGAASRAGETGGGEGARLLQFSCEANPKESNPRARAYITFRRAKGGRMKSLSPGKSMRAIRRACCRD